MPYRSHFKHNSQTVLSESFKYHHVCWVENVWKWDKSRYGFARVQMRGKVAGIKLEVQGWTEVDKFNKEIRAGRINRTWQEPSFSSQSP